MKKPYKIATVTCILLLFAGMSGAEYKFFSGNDWIAINKKPYSASIKLEVKALTLKTVQSASVLSGSPITPLNEKNYTRYIDILDQFYNNKSNRNIPLYFALKIASMKKKGIPSAQINIYKLAVQNKLRK